MLCTPPRRIPSHQSPTRSLKWKCGVLFKGPKVQRKSPVPLENAQGPKKTRIKIALKGTKKHSIMMLERQNRLLQEAFDSDPTWGPSVHGMRDYLREYLDPPAMREMREHLHQEIRCNLQLKQRNEQLGRVNERIVEALEKLPTSAKQALARMNVHFKFLAY